MKLFLIDPHDARLYNDGLFDINLDPNFILWRQVRDFVKKRGIQIATIDRYPLEEAERLYFLDHNFFSLQKKGVSPYLQKCIDEGIPKSKLSLAISECPIIKPESWDPENHSYYSRIYTWNDSLIDHKKYYPYRWMQNINGAIKDIVPFREKKLLTLINAHKTNYLPKELYSKRIEAIRFYQKYYPNDFDLYGIGWDQPLNIKFVYSVLKGNILKVPQFLRDYISSYQGYSAYKGSVEDKIETMSKYKFCLCFENMHKIDGYITEKIFDALKAGCVPIYLGAENIKKYVPAEAFVDFRDFSNFKKLTAFLQDMTEQQYQGYLHARYLFLKNDFKNWDYKHFSDDVFLID